MEDTLNDSQNNKDALVKERGQRVRSRFRKEAISGVNDPKLLEVLGFVCDYWKDNFRPAFVTLCCEAVGGQAGAADDVGLMMSLTSAGGGIHDDIVDKSSNKHFRMTVMGKYGQDAAVRNFVEKTYQPKKLYAVIESFGRWTLEVCEAEFMEIQCRQNLETKLDCYQEILTKSMADIHACARLGAIIGNGSESEIEELTRFARGLGFMYRLIDDLKDTLNIEFSLSNRLRYESVPLPILYAASRSNQRKSAINEVFKKIVENNLNLDTLFRICIETRAFDYVAKLGKRTAREALSNLEKLKPSLAKSLLAYMLNESFKEITELKAKSDKYYQQGLFS